MKVYAPSIPSWIKDIKEEQVAAYVAQGWVLLEPTKKTEVDDVDNAPKPKSRRSSKTDSATVENTKEMGDTNNAK